MLLCTPDLPIIIDSMENLNVSISLSGTKLFWSLEAREGIREAKLSVGNNINSKTLAEA